MDYLLAENLSCIRGSNTVFKNLSFKVSRGQILHITGANGSGKTSLLRMIAGFIYPSEGKIIPEKNEPITKITKVACIKFAVTSPNAVQIHF